MKHAKERLFLQEILNGEKSSKIMRDGRYGRNYFKALLGKKGAAPKDLLSADHLHFKMQPTAYLLSQQQTREVNLY